MALEALAAINAIVMSTALALDHRATSARAASVIVAAMSTTAPLLASVLRTGTASLTNYSAGSVILATTLVSYPIGGLVLAIPAGLLLAAGALHLLAAERVIDERIRASRRAHLIGGSVLAVLGLPLMLSFTPLAGLGLLFTIYAILLVGKGLATGVRRQREHAIAWVAAPLGVLGLQALGVAAVLSATATFSE